MGKPSIGTAVTPTIESEMRKEVKTLTVLHEDSKESIYYKIFLEKDKGGMEEYE